MPDDEIVGYLPPEVVKGDSIWKSALEEMCKDAGTPSKTSMESEVRLLKDVAEEAPPSRCSARTSGTCFSRPRRSQGRARVDPASARVARSPSLDENGKVHRPRRHFPHEPQKKTAEAAAPVCDPVESITSDLIAIGNGTASRERTRSSPPLRTNSRLTARPASS